MAETSKTKCVWENIFDVIEINSLNQGHLFAGIISIISGLWINFSILATKLRFDQSYMNLVKFTSAACFGRIIGTFSRHVLKHFTAGADWEETSWMFWGFVETYFAAFEIEWLAHVCIERYVVAKYNAKGWQINQDHYNLYETLCIYFAALYACLPLFSIGRYGYDLTCDSYTFDMILPNSWWKYPILAVFFLRSVKPVIFMFVMLLWARSYESKYVYNEKNRKQQNFTKNIILVTLVNLYCWAPIAMIRGNIIVSQLFDSTQPHVIADAYWIKWALWIHWFSPTATTITLFIIDDNIRYNMVNVFGKEDETPAVVDVGVTSTGDDKEKTN